MSAISLRGARLSYGDRVLWDGLDLEVEPGEFLAVLGPNGSGKTSLMRVLLGLQPLSSGSVTVAGGNHAIGYVPQQRALEQSMTLRGRDLVGLGLDGYRWGLGVRNRRERRVRVDEAIAAVGASRYADAP